MPLLGLNLTCEWDVIVFIGNLSSLKLESIVRALNWKVDSRAGQAIRKSYRFLPIIRAQGKKLPGALYI